MTNEQKAKKIVDMLVANGAISPGNDPYWEPFPPTYEGAYLIVLEVLKEDERTGRSGEGV